MTDPTPTRTLLLDLFEAAYGMDADDPEVVELVDSMDAPAQTALVDKLDRALRDVCGLTEDQDLPSALSALAHFDVFVEDEISSHPVYSNYENDW